MDEYLNCEMEMGKCNRKVIERIGKVEREGLGRGGNHEVRGEGGVRR